MNNTKKFWLITIIYLVVFWFLPFSPLWTDSFFSFFDSFLREFNIHMAGFVFFYLLLVPIVILLCYLLTRKLKLRFKKTLFILFYIVLPYISVILFFYYALAKIVSNPGLLSL
jgi:hypothetical protein